MAKKKVNILRVLSCVIIIAATFALSGMLCYLHDMYMDETAVIIFLNFVFLFTFLPGMKYERKKGRISGNSQTTYVRLATAYFISCTMSFGMAYMPEFSLPVMLIPILISSVSNPLMAVSAGLFFDIILSLTSGGNFYALSCYVLLTLTGSLISEALSEKKGKKKLLFCCFLINLVFPSALYFLGSYEVNLMTVYYGLGNGILSVFFAGLIFPKLSQSSMKEVQNRMVDITSVDYPEVKALKDFSLKEYRHAVHVSNVAYMCAKETGLDKNLCLAAGFYYRMGQWLGEPSVKNGVDKAGALCFPEQVITILSEYYGLEKYPSTPESALVHMVDALVVQLDNEKESGKRSGIIDHGKKEIYIYHTINELSSSGIYDKSGLGMNLYLKIRGYLAKEELLH